MEIGNYIRYARYMSDGDGIGTAIADNLKDLGTETAKTAVSIPKSFVKNVVSQVSGKTATSDEELKKRADFASAKRRTQEIEAEMQRLAKQREQLTGPEIKKSENTEENASLSQESGKPVNISLQRAQTRMESDKANKG